MKTWTFVTAVFWLFYNMSVCPLSSEQMTEDGQSVRTATMRADPFQQNWTGLNVVRPPPPGELRPARSDTV